MVRSSFGDAETQRFALARLMNVCRHAESVARITAPEELPPLLRKLPKAHTSGLDKGGVPPAEAQRAAAILRAIDAHVAENSSTSMLICAAPLAVRPSPVVRTRKPRTGRCGSKVQ